MRKLRLIRFPATWCAPCKMFAQTFAKLKEQDGFENDVFVEYDAEDSPEEVEKYGVMNLPTTTVVDAETGEFIANITGNLRLEDLVKTINELR